MSIHLNSITVDKIKNLEAQDKLQLVGDSSRSVYRILSDEIGDQDYTDAVLKYATFEMGHKGNIYEIRTWNAVKGTSMEQYFAPIRDHARNNKILIMDYASPNNITRDQSSQLKQDLDDTRLENATVASRLFDTKDIYSGNCGQHPHKGIVLIDYPFGGDFNE